MPERVGEDFRRVSVTPAIMNAGKNKDRKVTNRRLNENECVNDGYANVSHYNVSATLRLYIIPYLLMLL
jgi:hypothetical protein